MTIIGYRALNENEIQAINQIKLLGEDVGVLVNAYLRDKELPTGEGVDARWVAIAKTHLQEGFMALTRAVAQPSTF